MQAYKWTPQGWVGTTLETLSPPPRLEVVVTPTHGRIEIAGSKDAVLKTAADYEAMYPEVAYGTTRTDVELTDGTYRSTLRYYSAD